MTPKKAVAAYLNFNKFFNNYTHQFQQRTRIIKLQLKLNFKLNGY